MYLGTYSGHVSWHVSEARISHVSWTRILARTYFDCFLSITNSCDGIVVITLRCGRNDPGSILGHGTIFALLFFLLHKQYFCPVLNSPPPNTPV